MMIEIPTKEKATQNQYCILYYSKLTTLFYVALKSIATYPVLQCVQWTKGGGL